MFLTWITYVLTKKKKKTTNKSSPTHKSTNNKPKLNEAFFLQRYLQLSCPKFLSRLGWKNTGWKTFSVSISIEHQHHHLSHGTFFLGWITYPIELKKAWFPNSEVAKSDMTLTHTWNSSNNWNCIKILHNLQFCNMVIVMVKSNIDFCLCCYWNNKKPTLSKQIYMPRNNKLNICNSQGKRLWSRGVLTSEFSI